MSFIRHPRSNRRVTLVDLIFCIVIVIVNITGYVKIRSPFPLFIGAALFLSGVSLGVIPPCLRPDREQEMIRAPDRNG